MPNVDIPAKWFKVSPGLKKKIITKIDKSKIDLSRGEDHYFSVIVDKQEAHRIPIFFEPKYLVMLQDFLIHGKTVEKDSMHFIRVFNYRLKPLRFIVRLDQKYFHLKGFC